VPWRQCFNFQWLAGFNAGSVFLLFTYTSHCRLFINRLFFEQLLPLSSLVRYPKRVFPTLALSGEDNATIT